MANKYTDNEGLFQGGKYGRFAGRFRDWWEDNTQDPYGHRDRRARERLSKDMGTDMPETYNKTTVDKWHRNKETGQLRTYDKDMPLDQAASMARSHALDFDVSNPDSVRILQQRLNESGYTDSEGNPLEVDSMFGEKTEFALRNLQNDLQSQQFGFQNQPQAPSQLSTASNSLPNNPSNRVPNTAYESNSGFASHSNVKPFGPYAKHSDVEPFGPYAKHSNIAPSNPANNASTANNYLNRGQGGGGMAYEDSVGNKRQF